MPHLPKVDLGPALRAPRLRGACAEALGAGMPRVRPGGGAQPRGQAETPYPPRPPRMQQGPGVRSCAALQGIPALHGTGVRL